MAHTVELLSLIQAYPDAFLKPTEAAVAAPAGTVEQFSDADQSELTALMTEFPEAFATPNEVTGSVQGAQASSEQVSSGSDSSELESESSDASMMIQPPAGYEMALHQPIATFGWGQVDVFLRYGDRGLQSIWILVGKSGTEVQSFCEAIARLTNRLLESGLPIPELVKELRGIRGGDSEGLGPHRFLGLVDLFGKVLQDAPKALTVAVPAPMPQADSKPAANVATPETQSVSVPESSSTATTNGHKSSADYQWMELSDNSAIASVCPECGAELQQVNGCSGGACLVCGYSSCS